MGRTSVFVSVHRFAGVTSHICANPAVWFVCADLHGVSGDVPKCVLKETSGSVTPQGVWLLSQIKCVTSGCSRVTHVNL